MAGEIVDMFGKKIDHKNKVEMLFQNVNFLCNAVTYFMDHNTVIKQGFKKDKNGKLILDKVGNPIPIQQKVRIFDDFMTWQKEMMEKGQKK